MTSTFDLKSYIGPVGKKELRQFEKAAASPLTRFEDELALQLYDAATYYPIADRKKVAGRNHLTAMAATENRANLAEQAFFANCLKVAQGEVGPNGNTVYSPPSERVILGPLAIYTFEFDVADIAFFRTQLSWLRSKGKKPVDCPMGRFYQTCSQWTDFKGLTVCWSGHKSLHIHAVFDTSSYLARFEQPAAQARAGMVDHWEQLETMLLDDLELTHTVHRPDSSLKYPEQYRRLPNGLRKIDSEGHLLGVPVGMIVPQITLWEMWRERASTKATTIFHSPTLFASNPVPSKTAAVRQRPSSIGTLSPEGIAHCEARLRDHFPDDSWPRLSHIALDGRQWKAWFFNRADDRTPSSYIREDYRTISVQGLGADGLKPAPLPASLGDCMSEWLAELGPMVETLEEISTSILPSKSPLSLAFAAATSKSAASSALDDHLPTTVLYRRYLLLQAPEGATKTTTIMRRHPWMVRNLARVDDSDLPSPRHSLYAFGSYYEAEQKCAAFNALHSGSDYLGVVLPSFAHAYQEARSLLGLPEITQESAGRQGHSSLWHAISVQQPAIIDLLEKQHQERWNMIGTRNPVWFTVHQVAHGWHTASLTRLMASPSFWSIHETERLTKCRAETCLSILVHDEIKASTFAEFAKSEATQWVGALRTSGAYHWDSLGLVSRLATYQNLAASMPPPLGIDFHTASKLAHIGKWDQVVTADTAEYGTGFGPRDIYAPRHGRVWSVSPRDWWKASDALRVVFLTTEEVPTAVAEKADKSIATYRLDSPLIPRDAIDAHPTRGVRGDNLEAQIEKWRTAHGDEKWFAVSNKLKGAEESLTHARARGSNDLIGKKIVQTMTFVSPDEYEELQALNAWCGRDDLVRLRHIDECNQTAGRNLGFRHRPGAEHALLINPGLLKLIEPVLGHSRYDFRIHETSNQRRTLTRKTSKGSSGQTVQSSKSANDNSGQSEPPAASEQHSGSSAE